MLRFIAAAMVVITHSTLYASERLGDEGIGIWSAGASGVDVFFVISGFVMVVSSRRGLGWIGPSDFIYRRVVRIFPPYWVATTINLIVLIALPSLVLHSALDWGSVLKSYLLIPDLTAEGKVEPLLGVGWTLYYETFFYAAFALALVLRLNPVWSVTVFMVGVAAGSGLKGPQSPAYLVYFDPIVLEFAAGMIIAWAAKNLVAPASIAAALLVIGFAVLLLLPEMPGSFRALASGIPASVIVMAAVMLEPYLRGRRWIQPLVFLGGASYVLYLFHPLVAPFAPTLLSRIGLANAPLSVMLSFASAVTFSAIVYQFAERPFLRLVKKPLKRSDNH